LFDVSDSNVNIVEDSSNRLELGLDRPVVPEGVLSGSEFDDMTRSMDRGVDDWVDSFFSESDWRDFEGYVEGNGFDIGDWRFSFSKSGREYSAVVSPGIDYSSENISSNLFRPDLDVHVDEVYSVDGISYDPVFSMDTRNPGFPEPVFVRLLEGLAEYSKEVLVEGLEREVY